MLPDHIIRRIEFECPDGCWSWTGAQDRDGYGRASWGDRSYALAHRVVYELVVSPIPHGLTIDHLCRNRPCVNPAHLRLLTVSANCSDNGSAERARRRTHCPQGHPYDDANTYMASVRGEAYRSCRTCNREAQRRLRARRQEGTR